MSLRIAFDLDGVLANMHRALNREAERSALAVGPSAPGDEALDIGRVTTESTETSATPDAPGRSSRVRRGFTRRDQRALWRAVEGIENFWESLDELCPGAVGRLYRLASEKRWEVLFITTRPATAGNTVQRQSQRWLERQGFPLPSVYVVQGSRGAVAKALDLDVVVDDRPENCLDVASESAARAILVWNDSGHADRPPAGRLDRTALRLGIGVVSSVDQCLDLLAALESGSDDPHPAERESLMHRLKASLGLGSRRPRDVAERASA